MKFTEAQLEAAITELLSAVGYPHSLGETLLREPQEVLILEDLRAFLSSRYRTEGVTASEIATVIRDLQGLSTGDLYASNKSFMKMLADGFMLKREDHHLPDLYIQLLDYSGLAPQHVPDPEHLRQIGSGSDTGSYGLWGTNKARFVTQLEITGPVENRIPDGVLYLNGLPLVVFEFKSAIREEATLHDAYVQLATRYRRDIPELLKYNAFCVLSDGVNNKSGSFFAPYDTFYAWRKTESGEVQEAEGINSLFSLIKGQFQPRRLLDILRNFIFVPDSSRHELKVLCRYPQYYAATKLFAHILQHKRPHGDGKGGTYFGATGCGKSYTMLYLSRLLMKSIELASPTLVLITDRTDLDDQLSRTFTNAKGFIGDAQIVSVESRQHLRELLKNRTSGGVFLTTIHKFTEDAQLFKKYQGKR